MSIAIGLLAVIATIGVVVAVYAWIEALRRAVRQHTDRDRS